MKNVPSKSTGDQLTAAEYNLGTNEELKNTVDDTGQSLSESDLFQLGKAIAAYAVAGDFYTDTGSPSAYLLQASGTLQVSPSYYLGMRTRFIPGNTNTGAATVNVSGLGVKSIKTAGGADPGAGAIVAGTIVELVYDNTNFIIYNTSGSGSEFSTGDAKLTLKAVADGGWVIMDDGTIGSSTSGASTRANADCELLFKLLWNNISDTWAPVITGRGASAAADWTANKEITLTLQLGRALSIAGTGSGLTARALGENLGEEAHQLTIAELASHTHTLTPNSALLQAAGGQTHTGGGFADGNIVAANTGGDSPHNTMQPSAFWNIMIKL